MMIYRASVFNLPGKFKPLEAQEVGMENDDAVPEKLKGESKLQVLQVSLPEINEVIKLFEIKKPTNDEGDDKVIDVDRTANLQLGAYVEFGHEKSEALGNNHCLHACDQVENGDFVY